MACDSTSFTRFWFVTIDPGIEEIDAKQVTDIIDSIVSDARGWKRFGYKFSRISVDDGLEWRTFGQCKQHVFHIRISHPTVVRNECGFGDLSCAKLLEGVILLNSERWLHGSEASGLSLNQYRIYVVNHEIGHLLGRGHTSCTDDVNQQCSIMYQQTISTGCCKPNVWPLSND